MFEVMEAFRFLLGFAGWGLWVALPVATFMGCQYFGVPMKTSAAAAVIVFAGLTGWQARGLLAGAQESAELRRAVEARIRAEAEAQTLAALVEQDRSEIRSEVNDAIIDIQRASLEAADVRGSCPITDAELDGLRRAFGFGAEAGRGSATGKSNDTMR